MPHLQLDVPNRYPADVKRTLAQRLGNLYAQIMQTTPDLVHITIRELDGGVWQSGVSEAVPSAIMSCDIRRGRPAEQRARLADALHTACVEDLGLNPESLYLEFTQHSGDEIFLKARVDGVLVGSLGRDWSPAEAEQPLIELMKAEHRAAS
jgi:phenylpyruvate tautomerase PptA (4-oxalocrotonate tautomerase family)